MSGDSKQRKRTTPRRAAKAQRTKLTVNVLIAEATSSRFQLTDEQLEQAKVLLGHNDACDSPKKKVPILKAWSFLKKHYGLKMGVNMFERLVCEKLDRTSWGQQ